MENQCQPVGQGTTPQPRICLTRVKVLSRPQNGGVPGLGDPRLLLILLLTVQHLPKGHSASTTSEEPRPDQRFPLLGNGTLILGPGPTTSAPWNFSTLEPEAQPKAVLKRTLIDLDPPIWLFPIVLLAILMAILITCCAGVGCWNYCRPELPSLNAEVELPVPYDIKNLMDLPPSYEEATEPPPYHIAILLENPEGALQRP